MSSLEKGHAIWDMDVAGQRWEDSQKAMEEDWPGIQEAFFTKLGTISEERVINPVTGGAKGKKPEEYALIPVQPLAEVARVYGAGCRKYSPRNWERGYEWSLSYSALHRHLAKFWGGESIDEDTGCHHLASVVFHALAMMEFESTHPEMDDRAHKQKEWHGRTEFRS